VKAVASGDEVALELHRFAIDRVAQLRRARAHVVRAHVLDLEVKPRTARNARGYQILHHLLLPVHGDRAAAGELIEGYSVIVALEAERDPAMHEPLAIHALAKAGVAHELDGSLLEHTRAHALLDVLAAPALDDHRVDSRAREEMREHEPRGAGAYDADLRPLSPHTTSRA